jgi:hypothetical protein
MFFVEDDMFLAPDFYAELRRLFSVKDEECPEDCFGVQLQAGDAMISPLAFDRRTWQMIRASAADFCRFDDYNWDLSMVHLWAKGLIPRRMVRPGYSRVRHAGRCEGWDNTERNKRGMKGANCEEQLASDKRTFLEQIARQKRGAKAEFHVVVKIPAQQHRGWGGWAHPKDQAHCEALAKP